MKRRLILHLGLSKTGTTSIQTFLRRNPAALAAAGVFYPKVSADNPDHPLFRSAALRPDLAEEINHKALGLEISRRGTVGPESSLDTPLWSTAFRQIEESGARTAIISYENFFARPERYRFDALGPVLRDFEVHGVIYLRQQENWATSLYGQLIRGRLRFQKSFSDFSLKSRLNLTYSSVLDAVQSHIPLDQLSVGDFEAAATAGLLEDFLDRTGLPRDILRSAGDQGVKNSSLPHWADLFLLWCNQHALPDEAFLDTRRALATSVTQSARPTLTPGLDLATPAERQRLQDDADADAERLAQRYGIVLSPPPRQRIAYRPFDDDDVKAIRDAVAPSVSRPTRDALSQI